MTQPVALLRSWRAESLSSVWSDAAHWWAPAVDAVADALSDPLADARPACEMLGRQRADAGIYLDEARADLQVATGLTGVPEVEAVELIDALTVGWVDRTLDTYFTSACVDPLTGLTSMPYLLARLSEVYADAGQRGVAVPDEYALVTVQTGGGHDPLQASLELTAVQAALRTAFPGGETLTKVGASFAVALARRTEPQLGESLARLRTELRGAEQDGLVSRTRVWLERLPSNPQDLPGLFRQLG